MSLSFCILGSGSAGNSTLLLFNGDGTTRYVLIDCGLSPRETTRRLKPLGVHPADLSDIVLTHLDRDHFTPTWMKVIARHDIHLHVHRRQQSRAGREGIDFRCASVFDDGIELDPNTRFESVPFAHDQLGTVGFVIEHRGARLGYATDLGRVPERLFDRFTALDALAMESNYDREMQVASARPAFLKRRIMNGRGHLSNEQTLEAVQRIADDSSLQHVALLHLSRQCNCPKRVSALYQQCAPHLAERLTITQQDRATPLLDVIAQHTPAVAPKPAPRPFQSELFSDASFFAHR